jgi:uncharacterized protein YcaQ
MPLSLVHARRVLSHVHGFASLRKGEEGIEEFFQRHKCIQQDPIDVAGRNADLTLVSRVSDYRQEYLYSLLYSKRRLFEYFCKMMSVLPMETFPIFRHKMKAFEEKVAPFFKEYRREVRQVLHTAQRDPVSSRELEDFGKSEWGWGRPAKISNILLTRLWVSGRLMIHHREGALKYYALTEDIIPANILTASPPKKGEDRKEIAWIIVSSSRLVSPSKAPEQWYDVGKTSEVKQILLELEREEKVFSLKIEGYKDALYAPIEDKDIWENPSFREEDFVRFMAPLDPLLWNRFLFNSLYDTDYRWEVYKKPHERKYGYYCLPILFNDNIVGYIDPFFRRKEGILEVRDMHIFSERIDRKRFEKALGREMERFLEYLGGKGLKIRKGRKWFPAQ